MGITHTHCFAVIRSSSEEGSYLRLVDFCITQLQAESNKEKEEEDWGAGVGYHPHELPGRPRGALQGQVEPAGSGFRFQGPGWNCEGRMQGVLHPLGR